MQIITCKKLIKKYGSIKAVDNIDFEILSGECFGFLGPNGAGKTTLMSIIYCFIPPTHGEVKVFNLDVTENPSEIKQKIGVMPQEDNLDPDLNVIENLIVYARYFNIPKKQSYKKALDLLEFVELKDKIKTKIDNLSGGMKRKLILARALINDPEILILDEPTTGLDPYTRHNVWDKLNHLKLNNITILLTTHYMEEAEKLCDRIAIINSGKIIICDSPKTLMNKFGGNLENVYLKLTGRSLES
ncbi:MAG: ABC transporter ATP-binding protein [Candidatus Firestonebacteria bacterium]|nr:ABC transporter ATP-binding protein [Candidatus Firestonebacteria bacterium]